MIRKSFDKWPHQWPGILFHKLNLTSSSLVVVQYGWRKLQSIILSNMKVIVHLLEENVQFDITSLLSLRWRAPCWEHLFHLAASSFASSVYTDLFAASHLAAIISHVNCKRFSVRVQSVMTWIFVEKDLRNIVLENQLGHSSLPICKDAERTANTSANFSTNGCCSSFWCSVSRPWNFNSCIFIFVSIVCNNITKNVNCRPAIWWLF